MLVIGSLLALISGMFNAAAAALEKWEGMRSGTGRKRARLLAALARRPLWLFAMALSALAWVAGAASLGDRFAVDGAGALRSVATSTGLWLMLAMAAWSQSLLQQAFRKANAATVSATNASVASPGLIGAGFALYGQVVPRVRAPSRSWRVFLSPSPALRCCSDLAPPAGLAPPVSPCHRARRPGPSSPQRPRGRRPGRLGYGSRAGPARAQRPQRS